MTYRLAILVALATSPACASVKSDLVGIDATLTACTKADESNNGMKICTAAAYEATDKLLNRVYTDEVTQLKEHTPTADDRETLDRLVASERAWITYRDAQCKLQGTEMLDGSGETLVIDGCLYTTTKQRVKTLETLFEQK